MVAVLTSDRLYVANVGDSGAILVHETSDGSMRVRQLSEHHDVKNEQELERLTALGLEQRQLKTSGRLGTHQNTRSIGDYSIKGGYQGCGHPLVGLTHWSHTLHIEGFSLIKVYLLLIN